MLSGSFACGTTPYFLARNGYQIDQLSKVIRILVLYFARYFHKVPISRIEASSANAGPRGPIFFGKEVTRVLIKLIPKNYEVLKSGTTS